MDTRSIIYDNFLKPFEERNYSNVGVELEFPLVNLNKEAVDETVCRGVFDYFMERGFKCEIEENNQALFIVNDDGDCLSFDNSYNNFEFALNYNGSLNNIADRFYVLVGMVQEYFLQHNHAIVGLGSNPYKKYTEKSHVDFSTYNMVDDYLNRFGKGSKYPDFPAFLSSAQTHLDIPLKDLPKAYTLFAKLDFARGLLFSNSPDFAREGYICYRDYLWEQSAFSLCPNITGKVEGRFETNDDLVDYIIKKGIFNRTRNGKYEIFEPVALEEYFKREDSNAEDINCYLSFKNVEITRRGTLEVRSDCAQPFDEAFLPAAFNLGIAHNMDKAAFILDEFFKSTGIDESNAVLREKTVRGELICERGALSEVLLRFVECAEEGLMRRRMGEEKLIGNLYKRARLLSCPAKAAYRMSEDELVRERMIIKRV